jgi:hypothetical protein
MCPNCNGNNPPDQAIQSLYNSLQSQSVQYGMIWLDVGIDKNYFILFVFNKKKKKNNVMVVGTMQTAIANLLLIWLMQLLILA